MSAPTLADRVEQADGASRELDVMIREAVDPEFTAEISHVSPGLRAFLIEHGGPGHSTTPPVWTPR